MNARKVTECDGCAGRLPERTRNRAQLLRALEVGDIFHAYSANAPSLICLVVSVSDARIEARTITHQLRLSFDRATGIAEWKDEELFGDKTMLCTIDSVAPLPVDMHNALIGLDRKYRLEHDWERKKLTDAEGDALVYAHHHYAANPL